MRNWRCIRVSRWQYMSPRPVFFFFFYDRLISVENLILTKFSGAAALGVAVSISGEMRIYRRAALLEIELRRNVKCAYRNN